MRPTNPESVDFSAKTAANAAESGEPDAAVTTTCPDDPVEVCIREADKEWHDGPGWYWWEAEYPEEGTCGAFPTEAECLASIVDAHGEHGKGWLRV